MDDNDKIVKGNVVEEQPEFISEQGYANNQGLMNNGFSTVNNNSTPGPNNLARGTGRFHNPMQMPNSGKNSKSKNTSKSDTLADKKGLEDKNDSLDNTKNNKTQQRNPLPGAVNGKNKPNSQTNQNQKKPTSNQDENNKNKLGKKMPAPKTGIGKAAAALSSLRSKRKDNNSGAEVETEEQQSGIRNLISILPIGNPVVRVVLLIAAPAIPIILLILAVTIIAGIIPTLANSGDMCSTNSNSTFVGTADEKEFLCKMQSPYGNKSYPVFGWVGEDRGDHTHTGVDLSLSCGTPIYAAQDGIVESAGSEGGYGNSVIIKHGNGEFYTRYGHMSAFNVSSGQTVTKGQQIGVTGNTGNSEGCHLHFEVRKSSTYGDAVSAINNYFNAGPSTLYSKTGKNMNVSGEFKQNCGSMWEGDPTGASIGSDSSEGGGYTGSAGYSVSNAQCCVTTTTTSSSSTGTGGYCPNGITVEGSGTFDLDEYVEKVTTAENGGAHEEALKAQAIAARTYALNSTKNCKNSIGNSQSAQVMAKSASDRVVQAVSSVRGAVMLYNGEVFSAQYLSFNGSCSGNTCTSTMHKAPDYKKTSTFTMPKSYLTINTTGHDNGMSQNGANYMATEQGKKYDEILRFFYADGIEITGASSSNSCYVTQNSFSGNVVRFYQTDYEDPYGTFGTIKTHGCGPTAMAVVVSSLSGSNHDPIELTNYACSNDFCTDNGTKNTFFASAGKKYGLKVKEITKSDKDEVLIALNRGDTMVISLMGHGTFTPNDGHFIVLTGSNGEEVSIHDPASRERSGQTFSFEKQIVSEASRFWIISK